MRALVCAAVSLCVLACAAPAHAQMNPQGWDAGMTVDGRPWLSVDGSWNGSDFVAAVRCPGGGVCVEQPLAVTASLSIDLSGAVPGDVFEIRYADGQTRRTPAWRGTPWLERGPSLSGTAAVGETVRATPGAWAGSGWDWGWPGGWSNESTTSIAACRTASGNDCAALTHHYPLSAKLDAATAGRYLFAVTHIYFWNGWVSVDAAAPYPIGDLTSGPLVGRSAPVGPVATATASIRSRAFLVKGRLSVARVMCLTRCTVKLTVSGSGKTMRRTLAITGTKGVTIPRRHGKLRVKIVVNGETLADGSTIAR